MQSTIYSAEDEQELMARLWSPAIKDNPLAFVMYVFPWGVKGTPLEHFQGPRKWQREVLLDVAEHIKLNQGKLDFDVLQEAISSGRGIGKSALDVVHADWLDDHRVGQQ
jgi:hypothetical protein